MSWHYLRELEGESLQDICLDGEQLPPLKLKITHAVFYCKGKLMDSYLDSLSGTMFAPLTGNLGEEKSKSSAVVSLARTSQLQEMEMDLTESDQECGEKWHGLLARFDPNSHLWRTVQCSLLEDLNESLQTLPQWGMTVGGELYLLPTLVQTTKEEESGLWRTPDTGAGGTSGLLKQGKTRRQNGQPIQIRLVDQVNNPKMWPTPRSCSAMAATITPESVWNEKRNPNLETIVGQRLWPTPTAHNSKETNAPSESTRNTPTLAAQAGGKLNPTWTEWLMGWPLGWTDLKPLEMDKSHFVPQPHGESLQKDN